MYTGINCTLSPAPSAGNANELMLQVGTVREAVCAHISVFQQSERWGVPVLVCLRNTSNYVSAVDGP